MSNLVELIKASGNTGTSGQSFKDHVTGASGGGVSMTSYQLGSMGSYSGTPNPPVETTYTTPQTWNIVITFSNYGANFSQIRRNGTSPWSFIGVANQTLNSVTWDNGAGTATLNTTVEGAYDANTLPGLSSFNVWYVGYTSPTQNPNSGSVSVEVYPLTTGGGSASGWDDYNLQWIYDPDTAAFNTNATTSSFSFRINKKAYPGWTTTYEWEIHSDSNYNNVLGTNSYTFSSDEAYDADVGYIRYRIKAAYNGGTPGSWTNYGVIHWTDPRDDI